MTLSKKIYTSLAVIFISVVATIIIFHSQLKKLIILRDEISELEQLHTKLVQMQLAHYKFLDALEEVMDDTRDAHLKKQKLSSINFEGELDPTKCGFGKWYYSYKNPFPQLDEFFNSLELPHKKIHNTAHLVIDAAKEGNYQRAFDLYEEIHNTHLPEMMKNYDKFNKGIDDIINDKKLNVESTTKKTYLLIDIISVITAAVVAIVFLIIYNLVKNLKSLTSGIISLTNNTHSTIQEISRTLEQSSQAMEQVQNSIQQVASATSTVSSSSQEISVHTQNTAKTADTGVKSVNEVISKFNSVQNCLEKNGEVIGSVYERSKEISEIVTMISKIAEQTNLLALNAAIEAARAGEAGRGFAVVADEVRKLAESSNQSSEKIARMIKNMQSDTQNIFESATNTLIESKEVIKLASTMQEGYKEIVNAIKGISQQVEQIAATSEETAASTQEITASNQEQTAAINEIAQSAQNIATQMDKLKLEISKLKI